MLLIGGCQRYKINRLHQHTEKYKGPQLTRRQAGEKQGQQRQSGAEHRHPPGGNRLLTAALEQKVPGGVQQRRAQQQTNGRQRHQSDS